MDPHEPSVVIPAESEIVRIEQQIESEIVQIEDRIVQRSSAWLRELASFATAMLVTLAGVVVAGVVGILFCYAFFVAAPLLFVAIAVATARSVRRQRALAG
jgi:hypothetical protein